ncbi:MAG: CHASE2 domain-containing protein, partial [Deltaproteobacteria bacterium]|nr:CHASE2 domain-containing protein [Deltaproteobacteria bacterium]
MKTSAKKTDILIAAIIALAFIALSFKAFPLFEGLERIIYSVEMRLDLPGSVGENRIAIVNIDEKSLKQLGPWPWPRNLLAEMINILKANGAKLIGLDLLYSQKEHNPGLNEIRKLHESISEYEKAAEADVAHSHEWILGRLEQIEKKMDNDRELSRAVRASKNIILPVVGKFGKLDTELVIPLDSFLKTNSLVSTRLSKDIKDHISVIRLRTPYRELSENCRGLGHINLSRVKSMEGQAHLPFINYRGNVIPSMSLRLALDYLNKSVEHLVILDEGVKLDQQFIPTTNGEIFIKFKGGRRSFPYYSFVDILKVKKVPAVFDNKIVLIGYTATEGGVSINTPVDPHMPRVELIANIIEGFMGGRYLKRPNNVLYAEAILMLVLGFVASFFFPRLNYFPRTLMIGAMLFGIFVTSLVFFMAFDIWFKTIYVAFSLVVLYVVFSVKELVVSEKSMILSAKESIETNRMLGLSLQSQGLLDLAFEKFRKCPLDDAMKDVIYNLALDFERKRMMNKAISVHEHILREGGTFRDLHVRIPKLRKFAGEMQLGKHGGQKAGQILISDDLETKPTVGRYEILGELGQGAMGVVYKAKDPRINRLVAIKTIRFSDDFEEKQAKEVKERFFKEAELAGKLSHPSIISIHDVGEDYELTYMAMELLEGKDLDYYCQKKNLLPLRKILDIVADTADALDYAHSHGVIHRDVKPGNIMLLKNGTIKVTDFGIAKAVSSSQTRSGIILGTPNYMSPEQINGMPLDGRS